MCVALTVKYDAATIPTVAGLDQFMSGGNGCACAMNHSPDSSTHPVFAAGTEPVSEVIVDTDGDSKCSWEMLSTCSNKCTAAMITAESPEVCKDGTADETDSGLTCWKDQDPEIPAPYACV